MEQRMTGTFYGVSVGPGDPELLTLQAVRLLRQCPVLAAPQTASGQMLALDIVRRALGSELDGSSTSARELCRLCEAFSNLFSRIEKNPYGNLLFTRAML